MEPEIIVRARSREILARYRAAIVPRVGERIQTSRGLVVVVALEHQPVGDVLASVEVEVDDC